MNIKSILCCIVLSALMFSCNKEPQTVPVTGITINPSSLSLVEGEIGNVDATVSPTNADNKTVIWTSSDGSIASVNNGKIIAIKAGSATITAKSDDGGFTSTCSVTVTPAYVSVTSISLSEKELALKEEDNLTLVATIFPEDATDKAVKWESSDPSIATVSSSGTITAKSSGSTIITVITNDGGKTATCLVVVSPAPKPFSRYLTFTSEGSTSISLDLNEENGPVLYYSYDKSDWTLWDYSRLTFTDENPLYLCGNNPGGFNSSWPGKRFDTRGSYYSCTGDIMSLINNEEPITWIPSQYCFYMLFKDNRLLKEAPELPATSLREGCYAKMFMGCRSLILTPELPATNLAQACYSEMFSDCISIIKGPSILPADDVYETSYYAMFSGCTSLTTAPELPATNLARNCYSNMFSDCTSLTATPELPATNLAQYCYHYMFSNCSSITRAPALNSTNLADGCYSFMFSGCTSLKSAPTLPAKYMKDSCYIGMFSNCTSLTSAPELPSIELKNSCYDRMFKDCISLATAPALPAEYLSSGCYSEMFRGCTSLTTAPVLPATYLEKACYYWMFYGCSSLNYIECMATDINEYNCVMYWTAGVAASGTFVKNPSMESWPISSSGIPYGWTVKNK